MEAGEVRSDVEVGAKAEIGGGVGVEVMIIGEAGVMAGVIAVVGTANALI